MTTPEFDTTAVEPSTTPTSEFRATPAGDESYHLIEMHPSITLREIAERRGVTLPAAHIAIRRLLGQGLIVEEAQRVPGKGSKLERRYWTAEAFQSERGGEE